MVGFEEGYKFFVDNSSAIVGAEMSGSYSWSKKDLFNEKSS